MNPATPALLAIGRNYADHAAELGAAPPRGLMLFMKNPASIIGDGAAIVIPAICREPGPQVDYEGELAVEIGRDCRDAPRAEALRFVAGYRIANDVSARWWQKEGAGGQFCRGKSFDTFCPLSGLTSAERIPNPNALQIQTRLNGELVQDASTASMIWPVDALIAELSRGMTLRAGTIILTGTPAGVGAGRKPPRFLAAGDVVEVQISGLGTLRNPVREA